MINKKVLLLGGNGYIGTRLYQHLLEREYNVDNVDLCWFGKVHKETIFMDYKHLTVDQLKKYSHIILLAAHSSVAMCKDNLLSAINNNANNFINLLDKTTDDQMLIYASTCAIYGNNSDLSTEETEIKPALNFYDYSKISTENIARLYNRKNVVGLRLGSVSGFSRNIRKENLINSLTLTHLQNKPLVVSNGNSMRSVLGVNDACRVIETIIAHNQIHRPIYNVTSVNDNIMNFATRVQQLSGADLIVNDSFHTDYSFYCSTELFEKDYNFQFTDTTDSIYDELMENYGLIEFNIDRGAVMYV
jgi:nucleoside-diphosphate-sugar epimerase